MEDQIKIAKKLSVFLENYEIKYELLGHRTVYTAFDKAATLKIKPGAVAKVLIMKIDRELAMAVIAGDRNLDIDKLQKLTKAKTAGFAKEKIIAETFKGVNPGAIPPFSRLWNIKVFCDKKLLEQPKIILSAGSYETSIKITPAAFKKLSADLAIGLFSKARDKKPKTKPKKKAIKTALKKRK